MTQLASKQAFAFRRGSRLIKTTPIVVDSLTDSFIIALRRPTTSLPFAWDTASQLQVTIVYRIDGIEYRCRGSVSGGVRYASVAGGGSGGDADTYKLIYNPLIVVPYDTGQKVVVDGIDYVRARRIGETAKTEILAWLELEQLSGSDIDTQLLQFDSYASLGPLFLAHRSVAVSGSAQTSEEYGDATLALDLGATSGDTAAFMASMYYGVNSSVTWTVEGSAPDGGELWDSSGNVGGNPCGIGAAVEWNPSTTGTTTYQAVVASTPNQHILTVIMLSGSATSAPSVPTVTTGTTSPATVTPVATPGANDLVLDSAIIIQDGTLAANGANQTAVPTTVLRLSAFIVGATSSQPGSAGVDQMSWTFGGPYGWRTCCATFAAASSGVNGTLTQTLAGLAKSVIGTVDIQGVVTKTLGVLTGVNTGTILIAGSCAKTLAALALVSSGGVAIAGDVSQTLASLTSVSSGTVSISGDVSKTLASIIPVAFGTVDIFGILTKTLGSLTLVAFDTAGVSGALTKTLAILSTRTANYKTAILASEPLAYYRLDELIGTTMADSSGHGYDGLWGSAVARGAISLLLNDLNKAGQFNGTYALDHTGHNLATIPSLAASSVSFEFLINGPPISEWPATMSGFGFSESDIFRLSSGSGFGTAPFNGSQIGFGCRIQKNSSINTFGYPTRPYLEFIRRNGDVVQRTCVAILDDFYGRRLLQTIYCVVITYDYVTGIVATYIDGIKITAVAQDGSSAPIYNNGALSLAPTQLAIGNCSDFNWYGTIDEFAVYDRVLSLAEIRHHVEIAKGPVFRKGVVPVRYVNGIANAVPVETVASQDVGVVSVLENLLDIDNVVPVREAASETPRVQVCKV